VVSVGEVLRGVYLLPKSRRRTQLLKLYREVLGRMGEVLPVSEPAAERFAVVGAALTRKGSPIPVNDIWVAAVALARNAVLVTNDAHFSHVEGLGVENWAA